MELEDDADVDAAVAELVRRSLDVVDVDVGNGAIRLRLALCKTDLGFAPRELRPAAVSVHVRLGEAELRRVELARGVQVAHVVPDERHHNASPGSSRNCFTVVRNCAPVAPSTAR